MAQDAVIVGAARTAVGRFGGMFKSTPAQDLGKLAVQEALRRARVDAVEVDELIFGNVLGAGLGQNVARQVALNAGLAVESNAYTINKVCASGLKSVMLAAQAIKAGDSGIVVAGGTENMSRAPYTLPGARWGHRMGDGKIIDTMVYDGLTDAFNQYHMGITAENVAEKFGITREAQDQLALESQNKAEAAVKEGRFQDEIVPVEVPQRKGEHQVCGTDEHPRFGTTLETLTNVRPAFKKDGTVTAGNASGINDGAAAVVVMSAERAKDMGLTPLAKIRSYGWGGVDPAIMGIGPVRATRSALTKAGMEVKDVELIEANEAFAAQALAVMQELELNRDNVNVNGGAIAIGHPIGASGARILVTLLYGMKERGVSTGLATLCIGGGQGAALIVER